MDTIAKIFMGVLLSRLESWVECYKILNEYQAGFRKGYSTVDCIYSLISIVKLHCMEPKKKVYAFFVDFKAAFDSVDRNSLFYKLLNQGVSSKFINILRILYRKTESCVWDGERVSEWFETNMGVKQGCLLSPLLFALFLNDLHDALDGGVNIARWQIKILMYADDVVILSDTPQKLQQMINQLANYCQHWNLSVNLDKSKVMIFGSGGRRARNEKWTFMDTPLEIVKSYLYLGIDLTPKLSLHQHLKKKLTAAKSSINAVWGNIIAKDVIPISSKMKIFAAVNRSFMCYGAQVWGSAEYDEVEKLQRFFLKKLICLPSSTPNYMLHLESGVKKLFLYTLKLHFGYILKVMQYPDDRLPKHLSKEVIKRNTFWVVEWRQLAEKCSMEIELNTNTLDTRTLREKTEEIISTLAVIHTSEFIASARNSTLHDEYSNLDYPAAEKYFNDSVPMHQIMTIFKTRGGLININARAFQRDTTGICSMCNMNESENAYHFVAICPALRDFRKQHFNQTIISRTEFLEYLNGKEFDKLYHFVKKSSAFRSFMINEFNF